MKWEYKVVSVFHLTRAEIEAEFCRLGADGWKLACKDIDHAIWERELVTEQPIAPRAPAAPRSTEARLRQRAKTA